jgi:hypothetical protein
MLPVLQAFSRAGYTLWLYLSIWFVTWHYVLMAGLVVGAVRRAAGGNCCRALLQARVQHLLLLQACNM